MQIIFRDDDTSCFATPAMLERIYARIWAARLPVCLAVIPAQSGNIRIPAGDRTFVDPNIHPAYRGQDAVFPITGNTELCAFLLEKAQAGLVEICLHGYSHDWVEFGSDDRALLTQKLADGGQILAQAFPGVEIRIFIAPYNNVSLVGFEAMLAAGYHTNLHAQSIPDGPSYAHLRQLADNVCVRLPGGQKIITGGHSEPTAAWPAEAEIAPSHATHVIINHYYTFYDNFGSPIADRFSTWDAFLDVFFDRYAGSVTTFSAAQATQVALDPFERTKGQSE